MTEDEIFELVENNEIETLKQLLISNPNIKDIENSDGLTLLFTAVRKNNFPVAKLLIDHKAHLEKKDLDNEDTVLIIAVYSNYYEIAKMLIENGANVNCKNDSNKDALYYASSKSYFKMQGLLLKYGAEKTNFIDTSLIYASAEGDLDRVKELLGENVDVNLRNYDGKSALMEACLGGHFEIAKKLIDYSADVNLQDYNYDYDDPLLEPGEGYKLFKTPLMRCVDANNIEAISFLIDNDANIDIQTDRGETALMMAVKNANDKIAKILIDSGADIYMTTDEGETAFFHAITKGNVTTVKLFGERKGVATVISTDEYYSRTALMFASEYGNVEVVKYLLSLDFAGIGMGNMAWQGDENDKGRTALMYASLNGHMEVVELLIEHSDINYRDTEGRTVLHYAYDKNYEEIVKFMLDNGANAKSIYSGSKTFIEHARYENRKWFTSLVLEKNSLKNPRRLVEILTEFTNETPIKYTTHDWKNRIPKKYHNNFSKFLSDVKEQFSIIDDELKILSPELYQVIYDFIINEGNRTSWSSLNGLEKYVNNGGEPSEYKIDGILFGDIINEFKHKIEFRNSEDQLRSIFDKWKDTLGRNFKLNIDDSLNGIPIYTNTKLFTSVIDSIFKDIQEKRSTFKEIKVMLIKPDFNYVELYIVHKESKANRSAEDMLKRFELEKGDIREIGKNLVNLCDWSIISADSDGKPYRVNYLKSEERDSIERDSKKSPLTVSFDLGFTHIFRFYK
ncbi:MAG: ankyrin repeat domain-containing protein [Flavobacteriaceae bacterium]|nr:ankyrin repeat domain-containing protein [Flavobacteriaceae bacterium]